MKHLPTIAGVLLGGVFLMASLTFLLGFMPDEMPKMSEAAEHFMTAVGPTGFMTFVKVCELVGAVLVMIPKTRGAGLLILGPILVNILAYHVFVAGDGIADPMVLAPSALAIYLLLVDARAFGRLVWRRAE